VLCWSIGRVRNVRNCVQTARVLVRYSVPKGQNKQFGDDELSHCQRS